MRPGTLKLKTPKKDNIISHWNGAHLVTQILLRSTQKSDFSPLFLSINESGATPKRNPLSSSKYMSQNSGLKQRKITSFNNKSMNISQTNKEISKQTNSPKPKDPKPELASTQNSCSNKETHSTPSHHKQLKLITYNACSLQKESKIIPILNLQPNIICIQEIWSHTEFNHLFPNSRSRIRQNEKGEGSLTAWDNSIQKIEDYEIGNDCILSKLIWQKHIQLFILNIYRTHQESLHYLLNCLYAKLPFELWDHLIVVGDFNVNMDAKNKETKKNHKNSQTTQIKAHLAY